MSEWIPCSERQPNKPGWYLVTFKLDEENFVGEKYTIGTRYFDRNGIWVTYFEDAIVAWAALPEPWNGEEK